jgi:hypothetical protein
MERCSGGGDVCCGGGRDNALERAAGTRARLANTDAFCGGWPGCAGDAAAIGRALTVGEPDAAALPGCGSGRLVAAALGAAGGAARGRRERGDVVGEIGGEAADAAAASIGGRSSPKPPSPTELGRSPDEM